MFLNLVQKALLRSERKGLAFSVSRLFNSRAFIRRQSSLAAMEFYTDEHKQIRDSLNKVSCLFLRVCLLLSPVYSITYLVNLIESTLQNRLRLGCFEHPLPLPQICKCACTGDS
uniref:Uncharacterized protein n=1 Tax=Octopus bimaculoides TaxID=37653 RepID=A0A0L8GE67_OCTBM